MKEDVLEAIFGGLSDALDQFLPEVHSNRVMYQFLASMYDQILTNEEGEIVIEEYLFWGPATTQVKEIFEKLGCRKQQNTCKEIQTDRYDPQRGKACYGTEIHFNEAFWDWVNMGNLDQYNQLLRAYGKPTIRRWTPQPAKRNGKRSKDKTKLLSARPSQPTITEAWASSQKVAKKMAYKQALDYLVELGLSWTLVDAYQKELPSTDPELRQYDERLYEQLIADGYSDYEYSKTEKGTDWRLLQLIGIEQRDNLPMTKVVLATIHCRHRVDDVPRESKLRMLVVETYLKYGASKQRINHY